MSSPPRARTCFLALVSTVAAIGLAACGAGKKDDRNSVGNPIIIGTTDPLVTLDPAGSYDYGSLLLQDQLFQFLMNVPAGSEQPVPDAAQSCAFSDPTTYKCTMKPNLIFSNGDPLTAVDVAFSFQRIVKINNPDGPASLIGNMVDVSAPNASTVVFKLKNANDQTWPFVLGTSAGPIVDHRVFPADKLLADAKTIGSGPYELGSFQKNQLVQLKTNPNYSGANVPKTGQIMLKYYTQSNNMKLDVQTGAIDIAWRNLSPEDVQSLKGNANVNVLTGAGGALRYIVFNLKTMPGNNEAQKLAIRRAMAYSIDRRDLADNVFKGTYQPAYSMVPQGIVGATEAFKTVYGDKPDPAKAKSVLQAAGVSIPVSMNINYTTDHYGPTSADEYNEIKRQLEATDLFKVDIQGTAYTTYTVQRTKDTYPIYQLGWFPDFVDGDNYLFNFLSPVNFARAHYCDNTRPTAPCVKDGVLPLLTTEETRSATPVREAAFAAIQMKLATGTMAYLPLLSGSQIAVTGKDISGVQQTLDATYQFRMWGISKS